jgi:hypothetical protein
MKRKIYTSLLLMCAFSLGLLAQNQITVEPGANLIEVIAEAEDGSTITIKPGKYKANFDDETQENANIEINGKSLTIIGEDKYDKPIIYIRAIDLIGEIENLTFENLEISGLPVDAETMEEDPTAEGEDLLGSYFVNMTTELVSLGNLTIKNCEVRNLFRAVIRGDRAEHDVNQIVVDDCIIHDIWNGSSYGVFRLQSNLKLNTFVLKNSTLYNVMVGIIQSENAPADYPKAVTVENCTFWNIGGGTNSRYQFDFKSSTALNFTMQHNILGKTNDIGLEEDFEILGWRFNYEGTTTTRAIANNIAPDYLVEANSEVYQGSFADINWSQNQFNLDIDPGFADPANGDFMLPDDSDLLMASLEGEIIGDPRWNPDKTNVPVTLMAQKLMVYPNPAKGVITVEMNEPGILNIYSITGAKVFSKEINSTISKLDVSELKPGMYFLKNGLGAAKLIVN